MPRVPECPSALVPQCLECKSAHVSLECPSNSSTRVPWVSVESPMSTQVSFECSSSKKETLLEIDSIDCNITGNRLLNSFIEFLKNFSEYVFYITVIVFCFLGNKMCKFYHVLLARYNHSKGFQKLSLNIL